MIRAFTQQQDHKAVDSCKALHQFVEFLIEIAVNTAVGVAGAFIPSLMAEGNILSKLASRNLLSWETNDYSKMIAPWDSAWRIESSTKDNPNQRGGAPRYQFLGPLMQYVERLPVQEATKASRKGAKVQMSGNYTQIEDDRISDGVDEDSMCGGFEGGKQDKNHDNEDKLRASLPKNWEKMEDEMYQFYDLLTRGVFIGQGGPSMWAVVMATANWHGDEDSIMGKMTNVSLRRKKFEKHLAKHIIGRTLGEGTNYIKCWHSVDPEEAEQHKAFTQGKPGRREPKWKTAYRKSLFFPEKDDPTFTCEIAHWYPATEGNSHENAFVGLDTLEKFDNNAYGFTLDELRQESWEHFKLYDNEVDKIDWMSWRLGSTKLPGWHVPVCVSDHLGPNNLNSNFARLTEHQRGIRIPWTCGGPRSERTARFRRAANLDESSSLYNRVEKWGEMNELFSDVIPRVSLS